MVEGATQSSQSEAENLNSSGRKTIKDGDPRKPGVKKFPRRLVRAALKRLR